MTNTVNSEIFVKILFSRIALKEISATLKFRDYGMICISKRRILARPDDTSSRSLAFRPLHHGYLAIFG